MPFFFSQDHVKSSLFSLPNSAHSGAPNDDANLDDISRDIHGERNGGVTMSLDEARAELGLAAMTPQDDAVISFALKHMTNASKSIQVFARLLMHSFVCTKVA
jgi:hypothetical protein